MPDRESSADKESAGSEPGLRTGQGGRPPFLALADTRPSLKDRVFRRRPAANAFVELNNLLAGTGDILAISEADIESICQNYGLDVRGTFAARCRKLYVDYFAWCLTDRNLTTEELDCLAHLAALLRLDSTTTAAIHRSVTRRVYLRTVEEVLADGEVSDEEREFLTRLSDRLDIPAGTAENILEMRRRQLDVRKSQRP